MAYLTQDDELGWVQAAAIFAPDIVRGTSKLGKSLARRITGKKKKRPSPGPAFTGGGGGIPLPLLLAAGGLAIYLFMK